MGPSSFTFSWWVLKTHVFQNRVRNGRPRSSKVTDFGTNRKRVCNFLLDINSNFGPFLPHFRDIAGFLLRRATQPMPPEFWGVPFVLDCRCCGFEERRPKLIIRVINFDPNTYAHGTSRHRQTDRRTNDGQKQLLSLAIPPFTLRASRGKNRQQH